VTDEQLAPLLMLGMGSPSKMGFFSPSGKALTTAPGKGTSQQYLAHLKKEPGATKEGKQTGLIQRLEEAPGTLTKEEVVSMWNPIELTETVKGQNPQASENYVPENRSRWVSERWQSEIFQAERAGDFSRAEELTRDWEYSEGLGHGSTKYGNEQKLNLPGGEEPKEILVQLPEREKSPYELTHKASGEVKGVFPNRDAAFEALQEYSQRGEGTQYQIGPQRSSPDYKSTHWDEPNVLAHIRTNKRDVGGVRALHAEEFQSDWHQTGQKKGYVDNDQKRVLENRLTEIQKAIRASNQQIAGDDNAGLLKKLDGDTSGLNVMISDHPEGGTNFADRNQNVDNDYASIGNIDRNGNLSTTKYTTPEQKILLEKQAELVRERNSIRNDLRPMSLSSGKVPDAPFKKDWHELAFKRFLMEGINDPSVDRITWTSGAVQADRYDLSKQIDELFVGYGTPGSVTISGTKDNDSVFSNSDVQLSQLDDYVGKEIADRIRKHIDDNPPSTAVKDAEKRIAEIKAATSGDVTGRGNLDQIREWSELNMFIGGAAPNSLTLSGVDLEVGGEFHKQLYDKKIPQFAKKFLKKYGVEPKRIGSNFWTTEYFQEEYGEFDTLQEAETFAADPANFDDGRRVLEPVFKARQLWYIDITPEMRQDLQQKGVPLAMNPFLRSEKLSPFMA